MGKEKKGIKLSEYPIAHSVATSFITKIQKLLPHHFFCPPNPNAPPTFFSPLWAAPAACWPP